MTHLLAIRGGELPERLVLIREGVNTLTDGALAMACQRAHELTGIYGFSVLELPADGYEALARLRPCCGFGDNSELPTATHWPPQASSCCPRGSIRTGP